MTTLGTKLIQLRKQRKLSQPKAAQIFEVAQSTYSEWESDKAIPKAENYLKIAEFYNVDLKELITGEPNISIKNKNGNVITGSNVKIDSSEALLKLAEGLEKLTQLVERLTQK